MPLIRHARLDEVGVLTGIGLRASEGAIVGLAEVGRMRRLAENAFVDFLFVIEPRTFSKFAGGLGRDAERAPGISVGSPISDC